MAAAGTGTTTLLAPQVVGVAVVPLKVTVLVPCVVPKVVPLIVTEVPVGPEVGERLVMCGVTVNVTPLLERLPTFTTTGPVVAFDGTSATILVLLQLVMDVAVVPLKVRVLVPWVVPKFDPLMVTEVPTGPEVGDRLLILGPLAANAAPKKIIQARTRNATRKILRFTVGTSGSIWPTLVSAHVNHSDHLEDNVNQWG